MIAQVILSIPAGRDRKAGLPRLAARTCTHGGNKWSCRQRSLSASSRGYIYTKRNLVMYPKKSSLSRGGDSPWRGRERSSCLPTPRPRQDDTPCRLITRDSDPPCVCVCVCVFGSGYSDTRDSPARVSLAGRRHLTLPTGPDIESSRSFIYIY